MNRCKVYLVGAGPGDLGLMTVKGLDCLRRADVIVYDQLVDHSLLDSVCTEAERIYVGKTGKYHAVEQKDINQILVDKAKEDKVVVRLKGGDPFVLGRGGEEAEALFLNDIPFEIVPGISSSIAAPAYAGIPVTHRGMASSFAVITGHEDEAKGGKSTIVWEHLARGVDTLVFLMGVGNLSQIVRKLLENGRDSATPIALVREGTYPTQETVVGTLADIIDKAAERKFRPPAVIVVGEVVKMREKIRWFDNRPLYGKRILVTRSRHQASALSNLLAERGAQSIEMPVIEIQALAVNDELDQAILNVNKYQWIVFTSVNGVESFFQRLHSLKLDARWLKDTRIGTMGTATAEALGQHGIRSDYIPDSFITQGFIEGLRNYSVSGNSFLLPRADIVDKELPNGISGLGGKVHEITAYKTVLAEEAVSDGKKRLLAGEIDVITFASSSTVTNLLSLLGDDKRVIDKAVVACIGPKTADTAVKAGLRVDIIAERYTIPDLVDAIEQHFKAEGREGK